MAKKEDFFSMLDGEFAEGGEILDIMKLAITDPNAELTEREKCRLFMARYLYAAAVEANNRAAEKFSIGAVDLMVDFWLMVGEAVACVTVQAFDSAPRSRRVVRNRVKEMLMQGYDHCIQLVDKYDGTSATEMDR